MPSYRHKLEFVCPTEHDTLKLGERLGEHAFDGLIVCLVGRLGAGKTVLARGFGQGLLIEDIITSPTFPIIQEYQGRLSFWHMDLYRLNSEDEVEETGAAELFGGSGVCLVEWPDRAGSLLDDETLWVQIDIEENGSRLVTIETNSDTIWDSIHFSAQ